MKRNIQVSKIENDLLVGARKYLVNNSYVEVSVPHLTFASGSCENMDTLFKLDCFGHEIFLCQTGQLYLETLVDEYHKVYCYGPSFRAEPRVDDRHLIEFPLLEIELNSSFHWLLEEIETMFASMFENVQDNNNIDHLAFPPYPKMRYKEVIKMFNLRWGDDVSSSIECKLTNINKGPVWLTHFPIEIKFFNMKQNEEFHDVVNSADLILPYSGEAAGAAEREFELDKLKNRLVNSLMFKQLEKHGKTIDVFDWYLNYYKEPRLPHSGCGIGIPRVIQYVLKKKDIRHCVTYPINKETIW